MSNARPTRDSMSLEEATVSNMWEIAARGGELVHLVYPVFLVCPVCSLRERTTQRSAQIAGFHRSLGSSTMETTGATLH